MCAVIGNKRQANGIAVHKAALRLVDWERSPHRSASSFSVTYAATCQLQYVSYQLQHSFLLLQQTIDTVTLALPLFDQRRGACALGACALAFSAITAAMLRSAREQRNLRAS